MAQSFKLLSSYPGAESAPKNIYNRQHRLDDISHHHAVSTGDHAVMHAVIEREKRDHAVDHAVIKWKISHHAVDHAVINWS